MSSEWLWTRPVRNFSSNLPAALLQVVHGLRMHAILVDTDVPIGAMRALLFHEVEAMRQLNS